VAQLSVQKRAILLARCALARLVPGLSLVVRVRVAAGCWVAWREFQRGAWVVAPAEVVRAIRALAASLQAIPRFVAFRFVCSVGVTLLAQRFRALAGQSVASLSLVAAVLGGPSLRATATAQAARSLAVALP